MALELASREPGSDMYDSMVATCATHTRTRSGTRTTRIRIEPRSTGGTIPPLSPLAGWAHITGTAQLCTKGNVTSGVNSPAGVHPKPTGAFNNRRRVGGVDKPTGRKTNTQSQHPSTWYPTQSTARGPRSSPVRPRPGPAGVALAAPNSARTSSRPVTRISRSW